MTRFILAIVAGYLAMALLVAVVFSLVFIAPDFAFEPNSREVTTGWIIYTATASFIAAVIGGHVAGRLARHRRAGAALAAVVLVLGMISAAANGARQMETPPAYTPSESIWDRGAHAVQPTSFAFIMPLVGSLGVVLGAYGLSRGLSAGKRQG